MAEAVSGADIFGSETVEAHELLTPAEAQYAALTYISRGWAVWAGPGLDADGVCACVARKRCRNPGKHARSGWGNDTRKSLTYEQAERWWSPDNARWNTEIVDQVFIVPYLSGLVVADVDDMDLWLSLDEKDRPETLWQKSGSGRGGHYLYKFEWDMEQKQPPTLPGRLLKKAGEVKFRGIICGAPSVHRGGGRYLWQNWGAEIAPAPDSLLVRDKTSSPSSADWDKIVESRPGKEFWSDMLFINDRGSLTSAGRAMTARPTVIFAVAASMAKWIEATFITEEEVIERLLAAAEENGAMETYGSEELIRQIKNGIETGKREQRVERRIDEH